jgi:hypothetical protein
LKDYLDDSTVLDRGKEKSDWPKPEYLKLNLSIGSAQQDVGVRQANR